MCVENRNSPAEAQRSRRTPNSGSPFKPRASAGEFTSPDLFQHRWRRAQKVEGLKNGEPERAEHDLNALRLDGCALPKWKITTSLKRNEQ